MRHLSLAPTSVPEARPLEFVDAAIASGCDSLGLRLHRSPNLPFHPVVGDQDLIREMSARLTGNELTVLDIFTFYLTPECDFDSFRRSLELGASFGARYALIQGDDPIEARLLDAFGRFCDLAQGFGLTAMVEFNPARPLANLTHATRLLEVANRRNAGICVDPLHLVRSGGRPDDLRAIPLGRLPYAQWSDGTLAPVSRRLSGEGELELAAILTALPPALPLSVEVPMPNDPTWTTRSWCRTVIEHTRAWLSRYGE